jgi:hypothetical protein
MVICADSTERSGNQDGRSETLDVGYGFAHESGVTLGGHEQFTLHHNTVNGEETLLSPASSP